MRIVFFISLGLLLSACNNIVSSGIDEDTGLAYWEVNDGNMSLRLIQRTPLQTQAFFLARGFEQQHTELIANSCVFQTIFKNISNQDSLPDTLTYNLDQWQIEHQGKYARLRAREAWERHWQAKGISKPVRLAFNWSLLPTVQSYQPGDYNWGMTTYNLPPGSVFDLTIYWQQGGIEHQARVRDIRCPVDIEDEEGDGQQ